MHSSKLAALVALGFAFVLGCASPPPDEDGDEAEEGNAAVSTPRDKEAADARTQATARTTELGRALQNAKPEDFGNAIPPNVKPTVDGLVRFYSHVDVDPNGRGYSFITGPTKAYVIETQPRDGGGGRLRKLYLYEAVGYPKAESKPTPIGVCQAPSLKPNAALSCKPAMDAGMQAP